MNPRLVPSDQIPYPQAMALTFRFNSDEVQQGNTKYLRFSIQHIVSESSKCLTSDPGDDISLRDCGATISLIPEEVIEA